MDNNMQQIADSFKGNIFVNSETPISEILDNPDDLASLYDRMKDLDGIKMGYEMFLKEMPGEGISALNIILKIADKLKELGYTYDKP